MFGQLSKSTETITAAGSSHDAEIGKTGFYFFSPWQYQGYKYLEHHENVRVALRAQPKITLEWVQ